MATAGPISDIAHIGETAGTVWKVLAENGPLSMAKLVKAVGEPRDTVMQALGWLAREGKLCIDEEGRSRVVSLRA
jgi:DNA-binding transcriptional ArsR family regulator